MLDVITESSDKDMINKWFWCDENIIPRTYILQPITDLLPDYNNRAVSKEQRSKASGEWWSAFERMQVVFRDASSKAMKGDKEAMWKYVMSGKNFLIISVYWYSGCFCLLTICYLSMTSCY